MAPGPFTPPPLPLGPLALAPLPPAPEVVASQPEPEAGVLEPPPAPNVLVAVLPPQAMRSKEVRMGTAWWESMVSLLATGARQPSKFAHGMTLGYI